jgi:diguanylate cyclase (GGDEF)-like protein/PAS domain S-box-containing protein
VGAFLGVNRTLATMLGYSSPEEFLAANAVCESILDPNMRAQLLGHVDQEEAAEPHEAVWKRKDGTTIKVQLSGRKVRSECGECAGYEIIAEDLTKRRAMEERLRQQAYTDALTGLANYRRLFEVLYSETKRSERTGRGFALALFDLDGLKQINDEYGHLTGSQALCRLAEVLSRYSRAIDTAARFGGDEFALVLPEIEAEMAHKAVQRVCDGLANDGKEPSISVSAGVALYPGDGHTVATLVYAADQALYSRKGAALNFVSMACGL